MSRGAFALALVLFAAPLGAEAQPAARTPRIGYLSPQAASLASPLFTAFREGLREHGYVDGQNIVIDPRSADGDLQRLSNLATELARLKVDVIVAAGGNLAVAAAQRATTTTPIVMTNTTDPVALGFVPSLARPGGNITGLSMQTTDVSGKRLQFLKEAVPNLSRVTIVWDPSQTGARTPVTEAEAAARGLGLEVQLLEARSASEIDRAFTTMSREGTSAAYAPGSPLFFAHRVRIAENAVNSSVPTICGGAEFGMAGCLISYGVNLRDLYRRAATYVDKILKGAKPADLPVEQPTKFELVINLKTAKALGLIIPASLLLRADRLIE